MYSLTFTIPESGSTRVNGFGGEPLDEKGRLTGYNAPRRIGLIAFKSNVPGEILQNCTATLKGYEDVITEPFSLPNNVFTELPCSVIVTGPPGLEVTIEAWETFSTGADRGAKITYTIPDEAENVVGPILSWFQSFDVLGSDEMIVEFFDDTASLINRLTIPGGFASSLSIPDRAKQVRLRGAELSSIIFRQKG